MITWAIDHFKKLNVGWQLYICGVACLFFPIAITNSIFVALVVLSPFLMLAGIVAAIIQVENNRYR